LGKGNITYVKVNHHGTFIGLICKQCRSLQVKLNVHVLNPSRPKLLCMSSIAIQAKVN